MRHVKFPILAVLPLLMVTISATNVSVNSSCQNPLGSYLHTKPTTPNYNCYQYTRAALLQTNVNMATGVPFNESTFGSIPNTTIIGDQNFIRVCSLSQAKVVAFQNAGHASIKLMMEDLLLRSICIPTWKLHFTPKLDH